MAVQDLFGIVVKDTERLEFLCRALTFNSVPDSRVRDWFRKSRKERNPSVRSLEKFICVFLFFRWKERARKAMTASQDPIVPDRPFG